MKILKAFRNLDSHGRHRAPEVIEEEARQLAPHLKRFRDDLVRLEATVSQTKGKMRIHVSLRLQLPSGVIAAQEDGFEVEPVLRKAFADLRHRVDRHMARLKHEPEWKRPARRRRIGMLLPPARDTAEADRRAMYFDLIEEHLDRVYDAVRRELTYLQASGSVPPGRLGVGDLADATVLKGLERFETRPAEFSAGDWLIRLAHETIEAEARAARRALPEDAASLDAEPEKPEEDPTEADQELSEFHQPDEMLRLEDLVADEAGADPASEAERHEAARALHRAMAQLPSLWRRVLERIHLADETPAEAAAALGLDAAESDRIAQAAMAFLRAKLIEAGFSGETVETAKLEQEIARTAHLPQPILERQRIVIALRGEAEPLARPAQSAAAEQPRSMEGS
ncbi:sigma-70 family RNA polymerase sigma factor [Pannonibacter indicus]|uniref:DNA-directed RNA polymerase specialized sigma subunit, sigma24 family n=1 Tax=Pannonibacter indicus TaxID=466044 RepID=A0A0K6IDD9_9HYPH|nr:sigma-70 family RNA polymerase sigma factor [Pannonibacter indicus]CUB01126.1 DNA-directed RNA polymerase specialized sigma subunit, sigma24 family [Pannonibacter indicus]